MDKYVYMSKKEIMKKIVAEMIESAEEGYITKKDILNQFVANGLYSSYKSAERSCTNSFGQVIKELGLKAKIMGKGRSARYYKEPPKDEEECNDSSETLSKAIILMIESQRSIMTTLADMQTEIDRLYDVMKEGLSKQTKPKATAHKDTAEGVKEFNFHIEVKDNVNRLIGQDASKLSFEWYSMYVEQMIGYISNKEKLTENQIKTFIYSEMSKEYGYNFGIEKKHFVSRTGRQPKSGVEIMYENKDFKSVFYNKIADRLAKDYGL